MRDRNARCIFGASGADRQASQPQQKPIAQVGLGANCRFLEEPPTWENSLGGKSFSSQSAKRTGSQSDTAAFLGNASLAVRNLPNLAARRISPI